MRETGGESRREAGRQADSNMSVKRPRCRCRLASRQACPPPSSSTISRRGRVIDCEEPRRHQSLLGATNHCLGILRNPKQ